MWTAGEPARVAGRGALAVLAHDALARWRWLIEEREADIAAIRARRGESGDTSDYWAVRAGRFPGAAGRPGGTPDPVLALLLGAVDRATTVLDVGAGRGRLALPLAAAARAVTAVEPAAAMREHLEADIAAAGLTNVRVVAATWADAAVEPADVVVCANVLAPIADAGAFLSKLDAHARRRCYVVMRATPLDEPLAGLWAAVHGAPYPRETTHADAYAALDALGIAAGVTMLPAGPGIWGHGFATRDEALRVVRDRLWLGPVGREPRADALVEEFVATAFVRAGEHYRLPARPARTAVLWWQKEEACSSPSDP
ncbi:MAG TPA: methyltransferase domain-containing protein [Thermomicrobiales bacterium]|nr:methyltransferase domain-containing protein [Thermomicrobiales bacterium]